MSSQPYQGVNSVSQTPSVSAVISTRNRGRSIVETIESILANDHKNFELLVVDQSTNKETEEAVQPFLHFPQLRYIHTNTQGTGLSRNIGLANAKADIVVYTDDDCTVSEKWLTSFEHVFNEHPNVAVAYCSVLPGSHDSSHGTIPNLRYDQDKLICSLKNYYRSIGLGAGMGVRKSVVEKWGGFDPSMGPGSPFRSGEDHDLALRTLSHHYCVFELASESVIHFGYRTWNEFRTVTARDWYSLGASHAKFIKKFNPQILPLVIYNIVVRSFLQPLTNIFHHSKPQGFKRAYFYLQGLIKGLQTPIDDQNLLYQLRQQST